MNELCHTTMCINFTNIILSKKSKILKKGTMILFIKFKNMCDEVYHLDMHS